MKDGTRLSEPSDEASNLVFPEASNLVFPEASNLVLPEASNMMFPEASNLVLPEASNMMLPKASNLIFSETSYYNDQCSVAPVQFTPSLEYFGSSHPERFLYPRLISPDSTLPEELNQIIPGQSVPSYDEFARGCRGQLSEIVKDNCIKNQGIIGEMNGQLSRDQKKSQPSSIQKKDASVPYGSTKRNSVN